MPKNIRTIELKAGHETRTRRGPRREVNRDQRHEIERRIASHGRHPGPRRSLGWSDPQRTFMP